MKLQGDYEDLNDAYSNLQRTSNLAQSTQKTQIQTLHHQVSLLQSDLTTYQQQARKSEEAVRHLQDELQEMSISRSQGQNGAHPKDWEIVREELKRQSTYLKTLESSNTRLTSEVVVLRQRASNAEVLKEEKRTLEKRLEGVDKLRTRCAELERELELGKKELASLRSEASTSTNAEASRQLSDLRLQHIRVIDDLGVAKSEVSFRDARIAELEENVAAIITQLEKTKKERDGLELRAANSERKLEIEKRECGFLKAMVVRVLLCCSPRS
jgi:mitotic spindle assembly checkpoint protein MAD1